MGKIVGCSEFKFHDQIRGFFRWSDVLKGKARTIEYRTHSFFGDSSYSKLIEPKLYFHASVSAWTTFTGKLREYCLPWRWKSAYLDPEENGKPPYRILVCTAVQEGKLPDDLRKVVGKSWFLTNLTINNHYNEFHWQEFLELPGQNDSFNTIRMSHPLGDCFGNTTYVTSGSLCHIYRRRTLFSTLKYLFLRQFSTSWKEVAIQAGNVSEKMLIQKTDEQAICNAGLIHG